MTRKSQLKIQQMAFMLMAVFFFFILAGLFYLIIQGQSWKKQASVLERNNAVELANMLGSSAEFTCGAYCVDADKLMVLRERTAYRDFWEDSGLEVRVIDGESERACSDGNYPDCNLIKISESDSGVKVSSFVSVCWRESVGGYVELVCKLGRFIVGYGGENA